MPISGYGYGQWSDVRHNDTMILSRVGNNIVSSKYGMPTRSDESDVVTCEQELLSNRNTYHYLDWYLIFWDIVV